MDHHIQNQTYTTVTNKQYKTNLFLKVTISSFCHRNNFCVEPVIDFCTLLLFCLIKGIINECHILKHLIFCYNMDTWNRDKLKFTSGFSFTYLFFNFT